MLELCPGVVMTGLHFGNQIKNARNFTRRKGTNSAFVVPSWRCGAIGRCTKRFSSFLHGI
mgnify:CR=1 FL=1